MKTILIVDDQQLVLLSLEKCLSDIGYKVLSSDNVFDAIKKYNKYKPDLVIVDINMPVLPTKNNEMLSLGVNEKASGLEIIKYIKTIKKHETPVMILSGNTDEEVIEKGFNLGAVDYMKKPLSLNEIGIRVKRLIAVGTNGNFITKNQFIQNKVVGIVIPCYNEEQRLLSDKFKTFVNKNLGYHLCFVNDGSIDNTLEVLYELKKGNKGKISVYNCEKNAGKAEAVRLGMLHLAKERQFDYIGFLDADLSTNFEDFKELVETIYNSDFKVVSGSRIARMGATIAKESARAIISKTVNLIIRKTLGMNFKDTQCGAKIMTKEVVELTFQKKFLTKWLFDVEIFMRMKKLYGSENVEQYICEKPLNSWIHMDGSKLSLKDSFKIIFQIGQIALHYK